jgi:HSP20 family protein
MTDVYFGTDLLFSELDRRQSQIYSLFGNFPSSLRSRRFGTFSRINIGTNDDTIEIIGFTSGVESTKLDISIDKGLLAIAGGRTTPEAQLPEAHGSMHRSASAAPSVKSSNCRSRPTPTGSSHAMSTDTC